MSISITIPGQARGGKNNVIVTRSGHRFPNKVYAAWRDKAVMQVKGQYRGKTCFTVPCFANIRYWKGDLRRRDVPAIMDGIWHVLERAGVVKDDCLLEDVQWESMPVDRKEPRVTIEIGEKGDHQL